MQPPLYGGARSEVVQECAKRWHADLIFSAQIVKLIFVALAVIEMTTAQLHSSQVSTMRVA